jgi:AraC family transcriptional regulator
MISQAIPNIFFCNARVTNSCITDEIHMKYISEAVDYINKNYSKDITLAEITRQAYLSKFHFSRIFKKHTSYSPYQYLISVRLNHSRQFLSDGKYSIKEVADMCGFKRLDYFSATFKKKFKCNPSTYKESFNCCLK